MRQSVRLIRQCLAKLPGGDDNDAKEPINPQGGLGMALRSDSRDPVIYTSRNNGATWDSEKLNSITPSAVSIPSDKVAYVVCSEGVLLKYQDN